MADLTSMQHFPRSCALNALQTKSLENSTDPNATTEMEPQNESNLGVKKELQLSENCMVSTRFYWWFIKEHYVITYNM